MKLSKLINLLIVFSSFMTTAFANERLNVGTNSNRLLPSSRYEVVPDFQVMRLGNFKGQYLHVLYVISYNPFIATTVEQTIVRAIRAPMGTFKIENDSLVVPSISIEKTGISGAYNNILFVVSKDENFSWKNSDLSNIEGYSDTGFHQKTQVKSVKLSEIDAFKKSGAPTPMPVSIID